VLRRRADVAAFAPSPLRGEGWGEGLYWPDSKIEACFDAAVAQDSPLTSILSPEGRGGERKEPVLI